MENQKAIFEFDQLNANMMLSHRYRCIFAHVPKCAGTSMKRALDLQFVVPPYWHCTWEEAEAAIGGEILKSYFKFAVVRNPWDRVVSAWKMIQDKPWCRQEKDYTLSEFLGVVTDETINYRARYQSEAEQMRWQKTIENIRHHTLPCLHPYYGVVNGSGALVIDQVIDCESMHAGFKELLEHLGANSINLPRDNTTTHAHYSTYYDDATKETVARYYAADIREFKYCFEPAPDPQRSN